MKNKADNQVKSPAEDDAPRDSLIDRIRPFVLVLLLVVLPIALFHAFKEYMYVCRIPAGTKTVDSTMVPRRSPLGEFIYSSFGHCAALKHVTFPNSLETISPGAFPYPNFLNSLDQETKERIDQLTPKPPPGTRRMRE